MALLNLSRSDLGAVLLATQLEESLTDLLSRHKRRPGQPTQVRRRDGTSLFVQVQHEAPSLASQAPVPTQPAPQALDALHSLDTGDLRWRNAADKVRRVLDKPIPLLIQGESGVGKELFARASHDTGPRKNKAFIAINCAAVPENLQGYRI
jgi:transcriptional regulator with PAS, ATPase and Fis domain